MLDTKRLQMLTLGRDRPLPTSKQVAMVTDILNWLAQGCTVRQSIQLVYSSALELKDKRLVWILEQTQQRLSEGKTLAQALKPWIDETLYVILSSGAETDVILTFVARYQTMLEQRAILQRAILGRLTYPLVLLLFSITAVLAIGGQLLPRFAPLLGALANQTEHWPWWSRVLAQVAHIMPVLLLMVSVVITVIFVVVMHGRGIEQSMWLQWVTQTRAYQIFRGWCAVNVLNQLGLLIARGLSLGQAAELLSRSCSGLAARHLAYMRGRLAQGDTVLSDIMNSGLLDTASILRLRMAVGRHESRAEQLISIANNLAERTVKTVQSGLQRLMFMCYGVALSLFALIALGLGQMIFTVVATWQ